MSYLAMLLILFGPQKPAPVPAAPAQVSRTWPFKD